VKHVVDRLVDLDLLHDVAVEERERLVADVLDVLERRRLEVVETDDTMAIREQVLTEMRAEESGSAGDDRRGHERAMVSAESALSGAPYEGFTALSLSVNTRRVCVTWYLSTFLLGAPPVEDMGLAEIKRHGKQKKAGPEVHRVELQRLAVADEICNEPDDEPDQSQMVSVPSFNRQKGGPKAALL
jgi:hypothetical protein